MKNKWKELNDLREVEMVQNSEAEQKVEEAKATDVAETAEATETDAVKEICWKKLREQAEEFGMADEKAKELLDGMASELEKEKPNFEAFWEASNKLESLKAEAEPKVEKKPEATKAKVEAKLEEENGVVKTKVETKRGPMTKRERKKMKVTKTAESTKHEESEKTNFSRKLRHADQVYDAKVASVLQTIVIAAASGNTVEVLKLAEELAKATGKISFCTMEASDGTKVALLPNGLENVPVGKRILNFYSGLTSQTASGQPRRFATYSRSVFEELTGKSADKAEIIKVVVKDKKPSHTPPLLEDYL